MSETVKTITLSLPFRMGDVNCYLVQTDNGFVLIDTGPSNGRDELETELESAGCRPGNLNLIVLTHGDFDHIGNGAYLRRKFGTRIAMHRDDAGMAERGDMFWNRKKGNVLFRAIVPVLYRFSKSNRFEPDLFIEDGDDLAQYGFDAKVLDIPGHSSGSIGLLTSSDDLYCGDLFANTDKPGLSAIMDDLDAAIASLERLKRLPIGTVYPGHGRPFPMQQFIEMDQ